MLNWHSTNDYLADRYRFLKYVEEGPTAALTPYNDLARPGAAGFITIGVGFNLEGLEAVAIAVFSQFGLIYDNPALSDQPTAPGQPSPRDIENEYIAQLAASIIGSADPEDELNRIMAERAADTRLTALTDRRSTFAFHDDNEVKVVFDKLMTDIYEPMLNQWYSGNRNQKDIPDSPERIALLSLVWNGVISPGKSQGLRQAIQNDDRAEAWFEIRYNSNSSGQPANIRQGLAKRRYYEADTFGLYDHASAANDRDAKGAFRVYTRHREKIDSYDAAYGHQVALANSAYNTTVVHSRADWFAPAREYLRTNYFATVSTATLDGDIVVGENNGADGGVDTRYYRNGRVNDDIDFDLRGGDNNDLIFADSGNDYVFGGAGQDVIYGGAGRDVITGGAGNDYIEGGAGDDIYYLGAGDGQDQIKDQDGTNLVVIDGMPVRSLVREIGGTDYQSPDGRFTAVMQGTSLLVTDTQSGTIVTLSNFVAERYGILFTEIAPLTPPSGLAPITNISTSPDLNVYTGTSAAETTNGSAINDDIYGGGGADYLLGGAGDDRIEGGSDTAGVVIDGGVGRDVIVGSNGNDRLIGGSATNTGVNEDDAIQGGDGDDYIEGGWGDDVLAGGAGHDILVGGEGHDIIHSASPMTALSRTWDVFTWPDPPGGEILYWEFDGDLYESDGLGDVAYGGKGLDLIIGGGGHDTFYGEDDNDTLAGNGGNDLLSGGAGRDSLDGGNGDDILFGGAGNDFMRGDGFSSTGSSVPGNDYLDGGVGEDEMYGRGGNDTLLGGADNDQILGGDGDDVIHGGDGDDFLQGGDGDGTGDGVDLIFGGAGIDTILGEEGDDTLLGGDDKDTLSGGQGADALDGGAGNDTLFGGAGDDILKGGVGEDVLIGDAGVDIFDGGEGNDIYYADKGDKVIWGQGQQRDLIKYTGPRADIQIEGYSLSDLVLGVMTDADGWQNLTLTQAVAPDPNGFAIRSEESLDQLIIQGGFLGAEHVYEIGGEVLTHAQLMAYAPALSLFGTVGGDVIFGSYQDDIIRGYFEYLSDPDGDDTINGQRGDDELDGGEGFDTYQFARGDGNDLLLDFIDNSRLVFDASVSATSLYLDIDDEADTRVARYSATDSVALIAPASMMSFEFSDGTILTYQEQGGGAGQDVFMGTSGADVLLGRAGNDVLNGGAGNDTIGGGGDHDTLAGGAGSDLLVGGIGSDTYLFNLGDGQDIVREGTETNGIIDHNVIRFGAGISWSSLSFSAVGNDLIISIAGTSDSITIDHWFDPNADYRIERLIFADVSSYPIGSMINLVLTNVGGSGNDVLYGDTAGSLTLQGLGGNDTLNGLAANETLDGGSGDDILDGGAGNDLLTGGTGNDIYRFGRGYGRDTILDSDDGSSVDAIVLAADVAPSQVQFARLGDDLLLLIGGTQDNLTVRNYFTTGAVDEIRFTNGTVFTPVNVPAITSNLAGTTGADLLIGTSAGDPIDALAGNDQIYAGAGDDIIQGGTGVDTIYGGEGADEINDADGQSDAIFGEGGGDTIVADGTLDGGDGDDVLTASGSTNSTLRGGAGKDILNGSAAGWQTIMDGGSGNDTYLVQTGSSRSDRITQNDTEAGKVDTVIFGAGVNPLSISLSFSYEGDLVINYTGASSLTITGFLLDETNGRKIDQFLFEDSPGTVWTAAYVESLLMTPSNGANYIRGTSGNDVIDGLGGDDVIRGGAGDDTLIGGGVGQQGSDRLYGEDGDDTLLGGTTSYGGAGNDVIRGSGGMFGESGNDILEVLEGSGGSLEGGSGSDTYVVNRGGAQTTQLSGIGDIDADGNYLDADPTSTDQLLFAAGITVNDVQLVRVGTESLRVEVYNRWGVIDRSVDVTGYFVAGNAASIIDEIRFTDAPSVVWTYADILSRVTEGSARSETVTSGNDADVLRGYGGDDLLRGNGGNDELIGGAGNDVLWGNDGADTYRFGHGQGYDEISDSLGSNVIAFDAGITLADVAFYRVSGRGHLDNSSFTSGDDLVIVLNGSSEQLRVRGYYSSQSASRIDLFTFSNGTSLNSAQLNGVVINQSGTANSQTGNTGNSTFIVDHRDDTVYGIEGGGIDTVQSSVSFVLNYEVDNLTLTGILNNTGEGNELNNVIQGNAGHNILSGGGYIGAGEGNADTLIGGQGDDTYYIDILGGNDYSGYTNTNDTVVELAGEGYDTVVYSGYSLQLADNIERVILGSYSTGFSAGTVPAGIDGRPRITGNALDNVIDASNANWSASLVLDGGAGADEMIGGRDGQTFVIDNAGDVIRFGVLGNPLGNVETYLSFTAPDFIRGITLLGTDTISATGNALNNTLDGSKNSAANVLTGGLGNDTYVVGAGDTIVEGLNGGVDLVQSASSYQLQDHLENLTLTGTAANATGNALDNELTGNASANILDGGAGIDRLVGGGGNDTYIVDGADVLVEGSNAGTDEVQSYVDFTLATNFENLTLLGTGNINATGNTVVNTIRGNAGNNLIDGGTGNDIMYGGAGDDIFIANATSDQANELAGEGIDEVRAGANYTLGGFVENLLLTGSGNFSGTGNTLDNVITGNTGNNNLSGGDGNDTLIGGTGTDQMTGGLGNDTFYVDASGDTTNEMSGQGLDAVYSSVSRNLASNIELLFLTDPTAITGGGTNISNLIRGSSADNTLTGGAGIDILEGGVGNDTLSNTTNKTLLNGGSGNDGLTGTAANDLLIGGTGNDTLATGSGADIIVFNAGDGQDTVAASTTRDNTLSLGGTTYANLLFQKIGNDLVLQVGGTDQITFTGYYAATANRSVNNLQIVIEGTSDYDLGSSDAMRNKKIETFNFEGLVAAFDTARAANPGLTTWALTNALLAQHLSGSDTAAVGGDLAYRYNRFGNFSDVSYTPALAILGASNFGSGAQNLQSLTSLQDTSVRLS